MTTVGQLISRARRMLRGSKREMFNVLAADAPAAQGYFVLANSLTGISVGDHLGLGAEVAYVTKKDETALRVDVVRGVDDTPTPVTQPAGTRVEVNWRHLTADLLGYFADEVRSWPTGIFGVGTETVAIPVSARSVDLPLTRYRFPLDATVKRQGYTDWVPLPARHHRVKTGLPTSEFPSGNALTVSRGWGGSTVIFEYAKGLDLSAVETLTTDLTAIGLTETLYDAALHGIAWRALAADEAGRSDRASQPEPRIADEVRSGDALRTASAYKAIRDLRLEEEAHRLRELYPLRFT